MPRRHCMDAWGQPSAPFAGARARSHQEAGRLFRAIPGSCELPVRRLATHRARGPGALGGLVNDAQGSGAEAALLEMREERRGGRRSGEAEAAGHPEESALSAVSAAAL